MHHFHVDFGNNPCEGEDVEEKDTGTKTRAFISTTRDENKSCLVILLILIFHRKIATPFLAHISSGGHNCGQLSRSDHQHAIENNSSGLLRDT